MDSEDEECVTKPDHIWSLLRPWTQHPMKQNLNEERYIFSPKLPENGVVAEYFSPVMRLTLRHHFRAGCVSG